MSDKLRKISKNQMAKTKDARSRNLNALAHVSQGHVRAKMTR